MSCVYDKERLTGYFDGELEAAEKADAEKHISACSECLRELGEIKSAARLVKELPRRRAPRSIAEGVSREIAAAGRVHSMAKYRKTILWTFAAAAAFLVVANVSYFSGREGVPPAGEMANAPTTPRIALVPSAAPKNSAVDEPLRRRQAAEMDKVGKDEQAPAPATKAPTAGEFRKKADGLLAEDKFKSEGAKDAGQRDENRAPAAKQAAEAPAPAKPQAPAAKEGELLGKAKEEKAAAPVPAPVTAPPAAAEKRDQALVLRELERARPELQQQKQLQDAAAAAPVRWTVSAPRASTVTRAKAEEILVAKGWLSGPSAAANAHGQQNNKLAGKANESPALAPLAVELTAAQFAELKKLLEAQSDVQLAMGGPEDAQLAQGGGRGAAPGARAAGLTSGGAKPAENDAKGAAAAPAKPAAEQPAPGAELKKADPASDGRKDRESGEKLKETLPADQAKSGAFGRRENESRQKFVLYFQDVPAGKK